MTETTTDPEPTPTVRLPNQRPGEDSDRPYRGRRMSWEEFYKMRPDLRPANDDGKQERAAGAGGASQLQATGPRRPGRGQHARIHNSKYDPRRPFPR